MNRLTDSAQTYLQSVRDRAVKYALENMEPFLAPACFEGLKKQDWMCISRINPSTLHLYNEGGRVSLTISVDTYKSEVWARMCESTPQVPLREVRQSVEFLQDFLKAVEHLESIYADAAETIRSMHEDGQVWE